MRYDDDPWMAIVKETQDAVDQDRRKRGLPAHQWEHPLKPKSNERSNMAKGTLENITLNGKPVSVYVEEVENSAINKVKDSELREKSVGIKYTPATNYKANTSGARSERRDYAPHHVISDEARAEINFKSLYGGNQSVSDYVSTQGTASGTIEGAIEDAKGKLSLLRRERQRVDLDIARYEAVIASLSQALQIMSGKLIPTGMPVVEGNGGAKKMSPKGYWLDQAKDAMLSDNPPESKVSLIDYLVTKTGNVKPTVYQAVHAMIKSGKIMQDGGKIVWVG